MTIVFVIIIVIVIDFFLNFIGEMSKIGIQRREKEKVNFRSGSNKSVGVDFVTMLGR